MSEEYSGYGKRRESAARSERLQPPGLARRRRENRRGEKRRVKQADGTAKKERERERECERTPMESLTKVRIQGSPIANGKSREQDGRAAETASVHSWCTARDWVLPPSWPHKEPVVSTSFAHPCCFCAHWLGLGGTGVF